MNEPILEQDLAAPSVDEEVLALLAAICDGEHEPDGERLRRLARDSPEFREQLRDLQENMVASWPR